MVSNRISRADGPLWDDAFVDELANEVERLGLAVPAISTTLHWERQLSAAADETRASGIEAGERMLEIAEELGAGAVLIVPAVVDENTPYDDAYDRALDSIRTLARAGADRGVTVCVENVWNDFLLSPLEFARSSRRHPRPDRWARISMWETSNGSAVRHSGFESSATISNGFTSRITARMSIR